MSHRFVDKTRAMIVHEETGQVLEWNPAADKIVATTVSPVRHIAPPVGRSRCRRSSRPGFPDDADRRRRRELGQDARRRGALEMTETRPDYDEADEALVANALRQAFAEAVSVLIEALPDDRMRRIVISRSDGGRDART